MRHLGTWLIAAVLVALVMLATMPGCAMLEDYRWVTCYHTQPFEECKQ